MSCLVIHLVRSADKFVTLVRDIPIGNAHSANQLAGTDE
jgi:hypothetical protein